MMYSRIIGTGSYLPQKIVTNNDLEKMVDTTDEWIVERTGIKQRHIVAEGETASSMGIVAARNAIEAAGIKNNEIDLIIAATTTPDKVLPGAACLMQEGLDLPGVPAFDISAACAGFVYSISVADQFIRSGMYRTILVVGAEALTCLVDWEDRSTCVLFGDGAGAVLFQASKEPGIVSTHLHADGRYKDILTVSSGLPTQYKKDDPPYIRMKGREVFKFAVTALGDVIDETLAHNNMSRGDIDWLVPHQANQRIIAALAKRLDISMDRVILTLEDQGNTSAASVPLALDLAIRDGRVQRGDKLLLEAIGGGFTWASALVVY